VNLDEISRQADAAAAQGASAAVALAEARGRLDATAAATEEASGALQRFEAFEPLAARRPELLADGEACPLCGSVEHPFAKEVPPISGILGEQRARVAGLRVELAGLVEDAARAQAAIEQAGRDGRALSARRASMSEAQGVIERRFEELFAELEVDDADIAARVPQVRAFPDTDASASLSGLEAECDAALVELLARELAWVAARRDVDDADHRHREAESAFAAAEGRSRVAAEELRARRDAAAVERVRRDEARVLLVSVVGDETELDDAALASRWEREVAAWCSTEAQALAAERSCAELEGQMGVARRWLEEACEAAARQDSDTLEADAQCAATSLERAAVLGGQSADAAEQLQAQELSSARVALAAAQEQARAAMVARASTAATLASVGEECHSAVAERDGLVAARDEALDGRGVDLAWARACLAKDEGWRQDVRARLAALDTARGDALGELRVLREQRRGHSAAGAPSRTALQAADALAAVSQVAATLDERRVEILGRLRDDDRARAARVQLASVVGAQRQRAALWAEMSELLGSHDGSKFRVYAQGLTLDALLAHANEHLAELAPRYRLARVTGLDLDVCVVDRTLGGEQRGVNSLSGGETFLASLALALGLSSLSSQDVRVGSLFVDEGFGALDPETLDLALETLDALQSGGRQVGLVSHVPGLAERVGVRVQVTPQGGGSSTLQIRAT
jgi:exonuclease SbcC